MASLKLAYPFVHEDNVFVDFQTGEIVAAEDAFVNKYSVYSYEECELVASGQHLPECQCKYCINGREALISEY